MLLLAFGFSACKKESNPSPLPVLDSNFLKFTSSFAYNNTKTYVAAMQGSTFSHLEVFSQNLSVEAGASEYDEPARQVYAASIQFQNLRHTHSVQDVSINISWSDPATSTSKLATANLRLAYPGSNIWTSTTGTAHIARLGGGIIQGYFDATLTNAQQPGKSIQLTNGTFNIKYAL
jgi:hypothetical protein